MLIAGDPRTHRTCPTIMQRRQLLARQTELDSIMLATFGLLRIKNSTSSRMFCVLAETVLCIVFWSEIENERERIRSLLVKMCCIPHSSILLAWGGRVPQRVGIPLEETLCAIIFLWRHNNDRGLLMINLLKLQAASHKLLF